MKRRLTLRMSIKKHIARNLFVERKPLLLIPHLRLILKNDESKWYNEGLSFTHEYDQHRVQEGFIMAVEATSPCSWPFITNLQFHQHNSVTLRLLDLYDDAFVNVTLWFSNYYDFAKNKNG